MPEPTLSPRTLIPLGVAAALLPIIFVMGTQFGQMQFAINNLEAQAEELRDDQKVLEIRVRHLEQKIGGAANAKPSNPKAVATMLALSEGGGVWVPSTGPDFHRSLPDAEGRAAGRDPGDVEPDS